MSAVWRAPIDTQVLDASPNGVCVRKAPAGVHDAEIPMPSIRQRFVPNQTTKMRKI